MILLRRPNDDLVRRFIDRQRRYEFSYAHVGATNDPPRGYDVDHHRTTLGSGVQVFDAAVRALRQWRQFQLGWVRAWPAETPLVVGETVAVIARRMGLWYVNACRILYVVDEQGPVQRFGFAYGTLPGHVEMGEERFLLEWDQANGDVCYDIFAVSRPRHPLAKIGYPVVRRIQKQFARESMAAMQRAVSRQLAGP